MRKLSLAILALGLLAGAATAGAQTTMQSRKTDDNAQVAAPGEDPTIAILAPYADKISPSQKAQLGILKQLQNDTIVQSAMQYKSVQELRKNCAKQGGDPSAMADGAILSRYLESLVAANNEKLSVAAQKITFLPPDVMANYLGANAGYMMGMLTANGGGGGLYLNNTDACELLQTMTAKQFPTPTTPELPVAKAEAFSGHERGLCLIKWQTKAEDGNYVSGQIRFDNTGTAPSLTFLSQLYDNKDNAPLTVYKSRLLFGNVEIDNIALETTALGETLTTRTAGAAVVPVLASLLDAPFIFMMEDAKYHKNYAYVVPSEQLGMAALEFAECVAKVDPKMTNDLRTVGF